MKAEKQEELLTEAKRLYLSASFDGAWEAFRALADADSGEAMYFLGEFYGNGYGHIAQDLKKAFQWRKKGAAAGFLLAQLNAVYMLSAKPERERLTAALFPQVLAASEAGDIFAANELADMYLYGMGTRKNTERALYWLGEASRDGFWRPLNKLGEIYLYGEGVAKDEARSENYFARAAEQGYGDAEGNLAMAYYRRGDYGRAMALLRRAFAHGALYDGDIANMLGIMKIEGQGCEENPSEGFAWLSRAAELGSTAGMNHLSMCYEQGLGTAGNLVKAERWARRAADKGHMGAAVRYGICLREKGDNKASYRYFKKAAEAGNPDGEAWLATCFLYGLGTEENRAEGKKWLLRAARQGEEHAKELLRREFGE